MVDKKVRTHRRVSDLDGLVLGAVNNDGSIVDGPGVTITGVLKK